MVKYKNTIVFLYCQVFIYNSIVIIDEEGSDSMLDKRIRELRIAHGMNQVEMAEKLSVTKQTVSNWENSNILPSIEMLSKIADCFSVSTDYLLGRNEKAVIYVDGLSEKQISHIEQIVTDLKTR